MPWDLGTACNSGTFDWAFNQGDFSKVYKQNDYSKHGICEALSVSWIASQVQGSTLKKSLSWNGKVDTSKVATIAQRFATEYRHQTKTSTPGGGQKIEFGEQMGDKSMRSASGKYLKSVGLASFPFSNQLRDYSPKFYETFESLKKAKVYKANKVIYVLIGMQGKKWGHALAYRVDANKQTKFFDPNKGEFTFPTYDKFISWFKLYQRANISLYSWMTSLQTNAYYKSD